MAPNYYTDGSFQPNRGIGTYAIVNDDNTIVKSGQVAGARNHNDCELTAVNEAIKLVQKRGISYNIHTDSEYARQNGAALVHTKQEQGYDINLHQKSRDHAGIQRAHNAAKNAA